MNNNGSNKRGDIPEEFRPHIRRPVQSDLTHKEDVEGIRRPAASANGQSIQNTAASSQNAVRKPRNIKMIARPQSTAQSSAVQQPRGTAAVNPRARQQAASIPQPRRAMAQQESAKARSGEMQNSPSTQRRQNFSAADNTKSVDREMIRRKKAAEEAKKRRSTEEAPEEESSGGSTVMSLIKAILYIVIVVAVSGLLSYYIIVFVNDMYAFVKSDEEVEVSIPEYATVEEIADILSDAGVVKYPDLLVLYAKLKKIDKTYEFVEGDYTVNGMMNYDELFYAFVPHKSYEVVRITIPEGYTVDEIINLFTENGIGKRSKFIDVINNYDFDFDFVRALDEADLSGRTYRLEGYLYPDTYEFYKSSSEVTVIYKLLNRFNVIFSSDFYAKAEQLGYTVDEIMTLASMIEKEARYSADYELVSSVFHNRLNSANFPKLESDATIMYAIQVRDGERKNSLTGDDLSYDTPYNSYMYEGLPPGPIANPGYEAITCALWPASSKYYYFVSDNFGNTYFSRTNSEHEAAKAKVAQINEGS